MGRLILLALIVAAAVSLFISPWIAGLAYVANSLLQPQHIWHWVFQGIPIFRLTAGLAIAGLIFSLAQKKASFQIYKEKQNIMILVIWGWMHLSYFFSPYQGAPASVSPELVLGTVNSIFTMYFVLLPLCSSKKSVKYLCYTFMVVGGYYIYWANSAYLNQEWHKFVNNRLTGPRGSPYRDGNVLSTLIVMCLPFIILLYFKVRHWFFKFTIVAVVPLAWHAMVLFGSRAALLASIISLIPLAYVIRSKSANFAIGCSFLVFMAFQGALLIERATNTVSETGISEEQPINPRLISWEAGLRLIPEYPLFGVGVQMFEAATRNHFPGMTPHVAHNTFINFSANTGLLTGLLFLGLIYLSIKRLLEVRSKFSNLNDVNVYALMSSSISLIGFFICSMFLDLIIFEPFYIALMINVLAYKNIYADRPTGDRSHLQ